jgi:hypothetical protein
MFHLASVPPLPSLPLVTSTPAAFTKVDLVGWGYIAGSGPTNIGIYTGFYWSGAQVKSWGDNKINLGGTTTIDIGYGTLTVLTMDFTSPGTVGPLAATAHEAEVAAGDSGGGVFVNGGTGWQLAGIIDAEGTQLNQPGGTAVYGDKSYAADIATYRSEIMAVLSGGPVPALTITGSDTNTLIRWQDTGLAYTLQASSSLAAPNWSTVSQAQVSTNGQVTVLVPAINGFRSFRLRYP